MRDPMWCWARGPVATSMKTLRAIAMQEGIHPTYSEVDVTCSCGHVHKIKTTLTENLTVDVCGECHPFYTGKQKTLDVGGRIDRFNKRFGSLTSKK